MRIGVVPLVFGVSFVAALGITFGMNKKKLMEDDETQCGSEGSLPETRYRQPFPEQG